MTFTIPYQDDGVYPNDILHWLHEHVGGHTSRDGFRSVKGPGWGIFILHNYLGLVTGWCVDIDDEQIAVEFAMRWI